MFTIYHIRLWLQHKSSKIFVFCRNSLTTSHLRVKIILSNRNTLRRFLSFSRPIERLNPGRAPLDLRFGKCFGFAPPQSPKRGGYLIFLFHGSHSYTFMVAWSRDYFGVAQIGQPDRLAARRNLAFPRANSAQNFSHVASDSSINSTSLAPLANLHRRFSSVLCVGTSKTRAVVDAFIFSLSFSGPASLPLRFHAVNLHHIRLWFKRYFTFSVLT